MNVTPHGSAHLHHLAPYTGENCAIANRDTGDVCAADSQCVSDCCTPAYLLSTIKVYCCQ